MGDGDGSLLETKVIPPRRRHGVVQRSRLGERLRIDRLPPVVLVSAPAGFGKTKMLVEWVVGAEDANASTAWVSLDQRESDPTLFWSYVVAALRKIDSDLGSLALDRLRRAPAALDDVASALVNDLVHHDRIVDDHVFVYARTHGSRTLVIALNLPSRPAAVPHLGERLLATGDDPNSSPTLLAADEGRITVE